MSDVGENVYIRIYALDISVLGKFLSKRNPFPFLIPVAKKERVIVPFKFIATIWAVANDVFFVDDDSTRNFEFLKFKYQLVLWHVIILLVIILNHYHRDTIYTAVIQVYNRGLR